MEAFNELRKAAKDRRNKICAKAREEYYATLSRIAALEDDLLASAATMRRPIVACVSSVMPSDRPFTIPEVLRSLEALDSNRCWRKRSVEMCIFRLRSKGLLRRLRKARIGQDGTPTIYVRVGVPVEAQPFEDVTFADALFQVLHGKSMTPTELIVALLESGYQSSQRPAGLRNRAPRVMKRDKRFKRVGDDWSC